MVYFILSHWRSLAKAFQAGCRIWEAGFYKIGEAQSLRQRCAFHQRLGAAGSCRDSAQKTGKVLYPTHWWRPNRAARAETSQESAWKSSRLKPGVLPKPQGTQSRHEELSPQRQGQPWCSTAFPVLSLFFSLSFFIKLFSMGKTLCLQCLCCCYCCWELLEKFGKANLKYVLAG